MDEYISRNEAIEIISNAHFPEEDWDTENNASYALKLVRDYIPAKDVVPVVRCKDCALAFESKYNRGMICTKNGRLMLFDDFCSKGTRSDEK